MGTLITRHLSFPKILPRLNAIAHGVERLSAILAKYHVLALCVKDVPDISLLVGSEVEYLTLVVRSFYDLVQKLALAVSERLIRLDTGEKATAALPDSFAKMVLRDERVHDTDHLFRRYRIPEQLASFYAAEAPSF